GRRVTEPATGVPVAGSLGRRVTEPATVELAKRPCGSEQATPARLPCSDHLNLDPVVGRKGGHPDGCPGWWLGREVLTVDRVHRPELGEVAEIDGRLDNVRVVQANRTQETADVVEHLARLGFDPAHDRAAVTCCLANLAGGQDEAV